MPTFTPEQHAVEVHNELTECVQSLSKKAKKKLLKAMATAIEKLTTPVIDPPQKVNVVATSEGEAAIQRLDVRPPVTTSTNPTAP